MLELLGNFLANVVKNKIERLEHGVYVHIGIATLPLVVYYLQPALTSLEYPDMGLSRRIPPSDVNRATGGGDGAVKVRRAAGVSSKGADVGVSDPSRGPGGDRSNPAPMLGPKGELLRGRYSGSKYGWKYSG